MDNINEQRLEQMIDRMINIYVSFEEAIPLIKKYLDNNPVTGQELVKIYSYLSELIAKYEVGTTKQLNKDEINSFHYIIYRFKNLNRELTPIETYLLDRYDKACQKEEMLEGMSNSFVKRKENPHFKSSHLDETLLEDILNIDKTTAFTLIPIIITVTVLLGTVIAALMLVK